MPWPLHRLLAGHECSTAQQRGWAGIKNGELLRRADAEFDLFVTDDQGIRYQQSLAGRKIAILELSTNDLRRILAVSALIQQAARSAGVAEKEKGFTKLDFPSRLLKKPVV